MVISLETFRSSGEFGMGWGPVDKGKKLKLPGRWRAEGGCPYIHSKVKGPIRHPGDIGRRI
jgi:hypothetical protein